IGFLQHRCLAGCIPFNHDDFCGFSTVFGDVAFSVAGGSRDRDRSANDDLSADAPDDKVVFLVAISFYGNDLTNQE
ncbi:MAG: hypothetical protein ACK5MX_00325, partial [Pseudanabaena sp.]